MFSCLQNYNKIPPGVKLIGIQSLNIHHFQYYWFNNNYLQILGYGRIVLRMTTFAFLQVIIYQPNWSRCCNNMGMVEELWINNIYLNKDTLYLDPLLFHTNHSVQPHQEFL